MVNSFVGVDPSQCISRYVSGQEKLGSEEEDVVGGVGEKNLGGPTP